MKLLENTVIVEVNYSDNKSKVTFVCLDDLNGEIFEVNWNKQVYKNEKWIDDPEKAEKVEQWADKYFGTDFAGLDKCSGEKVSVYVYDNFCSFWEVEMVEKFTPDMNGQIYTTNIEKVIEGDYAVRIRYKIDGKLYETKHTHGMFIESLGKWMGDPIKKKKVYETFAEKYQCEVERSDALVGQQIFVEVKCAFKKYYYGDIKAFPKKGKK